MLKSLFSLIKTNAGKFKSEKQASYLLSRCEGGIYSERQALTFGEYEGRTARNTANVEWIFTLSLEGVEKVEKRTSKGVSIYWINIPEQTAKDAAKVERNRLDHLLCIKESMANSKETINSIVFDIKELLSIDSSSPYFDFIQETALPTLKSKLNNELSFYQEWAKNSNVKRFTYSELGL